MISLLMMVVLLAWPLQQLIHTTDFLLQQHITLEKQQRDFVASGQAKLISVKAVTRSTDAL